MKVTLSAQLRALIQKANERVISSHDPNVLKHLKVKEALASCKHHVIEQKIAFLNKKQPYYVLGDLHSDEATLKQFLEHIAFFERAQNGEAFQVVFLGDYVDRGAKHLETLTCLVDLSYHFPEHVCVLRGNHDGGSLGDDGQLTLPYRIPEGDDPLAYFPPYLSQLAKDKPDVDQELLPLFLEWFDSLPLIAFIGDDQHAIKCVHGGLVKPQEDQMAHYDFIKSLGDLTLTQERCEELFWSDPYGGSGERYLEKRRFKFTQANYLAYKERLGIDAMIRGHEMAIDGVRTHFDGTLYTLFSTGHSEDSHYTLVRPRYMTIDAQYRVSSHTIYPDGSIKGLHCFKLAMPQLSTERTIRVWVPDDYDVNTHKRYPVIYMHDGQNLFDQETSGYGDIWDVHSTISDLMRSQGFSGAIVVGIDNAEGTERLNEYSPWVSDRVEELKALVNPNEVTFGGKGSDYAAFIVDTLKPIIDMNYRTLAGREHTAVMGSSMGGFISLFMGVQYPHVFSKVGAFSTASWFAHDALITCLNGLDHSWPIKWYLDIGTHETSNADLLEFPDIYVKGTLDIERTLKAHGVDYDLVIEEGAIHNETAWARRLPHAVRWLFQV